MTPTAPPPPFKRLLLTGAAGTVGRLLRPRMAGWCQHLRLSDRADLGVAAAHEELHTVALEDAAAVHGLLAGVDAVVHLGGVSVEAAFAPILQANIAGLFHLYEAARHHGVRRVVFASSNHVVGYYRQGQTIDTTVRARPDTLYGLSKAFGEDLSRLYFDRHGIETVCLRIGSVTPAPIDRRMLATWLSADDLERLVYASLTAASVDHTVIYGMSDNAGSWWDNSGARHIGYRPRDSSDPWRAELLARQPALDRGNPATLHQGGQFLHSGPFDGPPDPRAAPPSAPGAD